MLHNTSVDAKDRLRGISNLILAYTESRMHLNKHMCIPLRRLSVLSSPVPRLSIISTYKVISSWILTFCICGSLTSDESNRTRGDECN